MSHTNVFHVKQANELTDAIQSSKKTGLPLLIKFEASWCGPCKKIAPALQQLAMVNRRVFFISIDVDEFQEIAAEFNIQSMPTFIGMKNGRIVGEVKGADVQRVRQLIDMLAF